jgi:hypothetical protein
MSRITLTTLLLLAAPVTLAAQQPAAAPAAQANPILTSFKSFGRYGTWLIAAFDSIPESRYGFKPVPVQLSVGYIAQHLETANYLLCGVFGDVRHPTTARDSLADSTKAQWPKDTLVARVRASFVFCDSALARLDDSKLGDPLSMAPGRPASPRMRFLLGYLTDVAEHYSQIAGYMRQMGMVPPSAQPRPRS